MTRDELIMLQVLPLEVKILKTKERLKDAIREFGHEGLYLSFSGGKDSTVLHHILLQVELELWGEKRIPRVFCNTGLEYPELVEFALQIADVELRPEMTFIDVIKNYGYPIISKKTSRMLYDLQNPTEKNKTTRELYLSDYRLKNGEVLDAPNRSFKLANKWRFLIDDDIPVANKCCDIMKKKPFSKYEKATKRIPIIGTMASESEQRELAYIQTGCNSFKSRKPKSMPLGFWRETDILEYILLFDVKIASVYGEIVEQQPLGQQSLFNDELAPKQYTTTGCKRTGCVFCAFGCHLEKGTNRFEQLKETHPKLHDYCIRGGKHDDNGKWIPHKGLGMGYVLDKIGVKY